MGTLLQRTITCAAVLLFLPGAGCKKTADNTINYKNAINSYYASHPSCLWGSPQQFPVQVSASDTDKTMRFDALFDQGLLTRSVGEKKKLLGLVDKQVTNYDLSEKGRAAWTADPTQPGFGNFCYGTRAVASIDSNTPNEGQPGATTVVSYRWRFSNSADWTKSAEVQNVYPNVRANLAGAGASTKTLLDADGGWVVQPSKDATPADGKVVE